jgi:CheY-like chemotaxis protein
MAIGQNGTRVLVVDDDLVFIDRARQALKEIATLRTARTGNDALAATLLWKPDVILFDLLMHDLDGFTFLEMLKDATPGTYPFILCTTDGRGADTRIRPLPNWKVGTLLRSSSTHQLRSAVIQAVRCQNPNNQRCMFA